MKGEIISCSHKDIYFLETNTKSESTDLANLFVSPAGREMFKYKPRTKLKQKLNPALEFFMQSKANEKSLETKQGQELSGAKNPSTSHQETSASTETTSRSGVSRRNSIDLYEEAATILGLTCSQTDSCKCIECQCHYFDFEEEIDFQTGSEYVVDHTSSCTIQ